MPNLFFINGKRTWDGRYGIKDDKKAGGAAKKAITVTVFSGKFWHILLL
jgi:hypothetical protein